MIIDNNGDEVKIGDKVFGEGFLYCQDGFKIDRTLEVTVRERDGKIYFGSLSKDSFPSFWLATEKNKVARKVQNSF